MYVSTAKKFTHKRKKIKIKNKNKTKLLIIADTESYGDYGFHNDEACCVNRFIIIIRPELRIFQ